MPGFDPSDEVDNLVMLPTHSLVASTQSSAEKVTDLIDHVVNTKLEEAAKVVAEMLDFANAARQHATRALIEHNDKPALTTSAAYNAEWQEKDVELLRDYEVIDERVEMLQRKLQMIRTAQAFKGDD